MGKGINLGRFADLQSGGVGLHAKVLDDFKDQLLIVFLKRLQALGQPLEFPITEVDNTGQDMVSCKVVDRTFHFVLTKKS